MVLTAGINTITYSVFGRSSDGKKTNGITTA